MGFRLHVGISGGGFPPPPCEALAQLHSHLNFLSTRAVTRHEVMALGSTDGLRDRFSSCVRLLPFTLFHQLMTFTSSNWPSQREETPFFTWIHWSWFPMADDFQCIAESMSRFGLLDFLLNLGGHSNGETWWSSVRHDFSHVSLGTSFAPLRGFCGTLRQHFSVTFASLAT